MSKRSSADNSDSPKIAHSRAKMKALGYRPNKKLKPLSRYSHTQSAETKEFRQKMESLDIDSLALSNTRLVIHEESLARLDGKRKKRKKSNWAKIVIAIADLKAPNLRGRKVEDLIII